MLAGPALETWLARYPELESNHPSKTVGIIMAGNVPFVGFHDLMCVLLSGHRAKVKVASDDAGLTPALLTLLAHFAPELADQVELSTGKLGDVDAIIATGSDNTARYFEHYFGHLPRIVRKSRTSVAVLDGTETEVELAALGEMCSAISAWVAATLARSSFPADRQALRCSSMEAYHQPQQVREQLRLQQSYGCLTRIDPGERFR